MAVMSDTRFLFRHSFLATIGKRELILLQRARHQDGLVQAAWATLCHSCRSFCRALYDLRSASTGLSLDARQAGIRPPNVPAATARRKGALEGLCNVMEFPLKALQPLRFQLGAQRHRPP